VCVFEVTEVTEPSNPLIWLRSAVTSRLPGYLLRDYVAFRSHNGVARLPFKNNFGFITIFLRGKTRFEINQKHNSSRKKSLNWREKE